MNPLSQPSLLEALAALPRDPLAPPANSHRIQAAVALVLREPDPVDLLLIKRSESPRDPWSGHMALPGGRLESGDAHLLETAMRETVEETGVVLAGAARFLGRLPTLMPTSRRLPPISVAPHVFLAGGGLTAQPASGEVESVHWVSLEALRRGAYHDEVEIHFPDEGPRRFPCYRVEGEVVWGMTYRILTEFLALL
ncbi:MAG: CoA pyrophosphatase [Gemmatimonadales bacterium]|jgi:8-oxo-dGTP pyrophosphatase MutT (NUDIX family)|nr:MAG: CoA pyrophosphatase [Gemmatimonadales bacterium]